MISHFNLVYTQCQSNGYLDIYFYKIFTFTPINIRFVGQTGTSCWKINHIPRTPIWGQNNKTLGKICYRIVLITYGWGFWWCYDHLFHQSTCSKYSRWIEPLLNETTTVKMGTTTYSTKPQKNIIIHNNNISFVIVAFNWCVFFSLTWISSTYSVDQIRII